MKAKKVLRSLFDQWIYRLGLRWWSVNIHWHKGKDARKYFVAGEDETILARTFADWRYSEANIHINTPALKDMSRADLEKLAIHELVHILVNEMREGELHHEERVVTTITKAILWAVSIKNEEETTALKEFGNNLGRWDKATRGLYKDLKKSECSAEEAAHAR